MISRKAALAVILLLLATSVAAIWAISAQTKSDLDHARHRAQAVLYDDHLSACRRGNDLRRRIQHNNKALAAGFRVQERFMRSAVVARRASGDAAVARAYQRELDELETHVNELQAQPTVNCSLIVRKPQ